jgi:hypothetical protein
MKKILKLSCTVQGGGIEVNVRMDMVLILMGGYDKGMVPFRKTHGKLIAYPVSFFGRNFPRLKCLPDLVEKNIFIPFLFPSGNVIILALGEQKLGVSRGRIAPICGNQKTVPRLVGVLTIVETFLQGRQNASAFVDMPRPEISSCRINPPS